MGTSWRACYVSSGVWGLQRNECFYTYLINFKMRNPGYQSKSRLLREGARRGEMARERESEIWVPCALEMSIKPWRVRVSGLSLEGVVLWEGVGLRPWACLRSGCAAGSDPAGQWSRLRPKDWRSALCKASWGSQSWMTPEGERISFECPLSSQRIQTRTSAVLAPTPSFPRSDAGGVNSNNLQVERGAGGLQNEVNQTSARLGRFTDLKCCPVGDGGSSRWSKSLNFWLLHQTRY